MSCTKPKFQPMKMPTMNHTEHDFIRFGEENIPEGYSYYKGTCCPMVPRGYCGFKQSSQKSIDEAIAHGMNPIKIGNLAIIEMDLMEETLRLADDGLASPCAIQCVIANPLIPAVSSTRTFMLHWYLNVHALLILNRISNDDMSGMMY